MTAITDRLRKIEDRLGVGACPRCTALPAIEVQFPPRGAEPEPAAGPAVCPDCGQREPERCVIVFTEREDGPQ